MCSGKELAGATGGELCIAADTGMFQAGTEIRYSPIPLLEREQADTETEVCTAFLKQQSVPLGWGRASVFFYFRKW